MTYQVAQDTPGSFTALIVQDAIFRSALWAQRISDVAEDFVVVRFPNRIENLVQCWSRFEASIALVDESMFEFLSPEVVSSMAKMGGPIRIIARIEGGESADALAGLLLRGCRGFVHEEISRASLRRVLRVVRQGDVAASRKVLSLALQNVLLGNGSPKLSRRELDVIGLLSQRLSNKTMAQQLFISEETLRWHLRNLYTKTGLDTRQDLVEYAATTIQRSQSPTTLNAFAVGRGSSG